jgi:hypothetical protein
MTEEERRKKADERRAESRRVAERRVSAVEPDVLKRGPALRRTKKTRRYHDRRRG